MSGVGALLFFMLAHVIGVLAAKHPSTGTWENSVWSLALVPFSLPGLLVDYPVYLILGDAPKWFLKSVLWSVGGATNACVYYWGARRLLR